MKSVGEHSSDPSSRGWYENRSARNQYRPRSGARPSQCGRPELGVGHGHRLGISHFVDGHARQDQSPRRPYRGQYRVSSRADIRAHDFVHLQHVDTRIGERCHIGVAAVIYPGVKVGDGCIVSPGAVVMRDVAAGCVVVGNPARVVEKDIRTGKFGVRLDAAAAEIASRSRRPGQARRRSPRQDQRTLLSEGRRRCRPAKDEAPKQTLIRSLNSSPAVASMSASRRGSPAARLRRFPAPRRGRRIRRRACRSRSGREGRRRRSPAPSQRRRRRRCPSARAPVAARAHNRPGP